MTEIIHIEPGPVSPLAKQRMVRMRDGARLATDVYIPSVKNAQSSGEHSEPRDTILIRLPYDKSGDYCFIDLIAEYFMAHDYVVVAQDVRGKFRSEGETLLFVNEVHDGYDTIEWISNQPWSNGNVAMWGDSYYGYTQWAAVASEHPALKAIAPRVTGTQLGEPVHVVPSEQQRRVDWAITYLYPLTYFLSNDAYFWEFDPDQRPFSAQAEVAMQRIGKRSISYDQWYPKPVYLRRFPDGSPFTRRAVPTLQTIGWWDNCAPLSWADVYEIQQRPDWDMHHFLRIESMDHEAYYLDDPAEVRVEEQTEQQRRASLPRMLDPTLAFFEVFVRGNGSWRDIPRVSWNLAHTSGMRKSDAWPPEEVTPEALFAHPDGTLQHSQPTQRTELSWVHDPTDLVPSSVPNAFAFLLFAPDETAITSRDDVLTFTADAQNADTDLVGRVTAHLTVGSDGPVMDVFVRLLDVAPDGTSFRIARGQRQIDHPDEATQLTIDLGEVGYRLRAGHRLQLTVASSDFPEFIPLPGTGEEPWGAVDRVSNLQRLTLGAPDSLQLTYSVLPNGGNQ